MFCVNCCSRDHLPFRVVPDSSGFRCLPSWWQTAALQSYVILQENFPEVLVWHVVILATAKVRKPFGNG